MSSHVCEFPKCAKVTDGHKFCSCHNEWIRCEGLCFNCLAQKESLKHKLCQACFQTEQEKEKKCHFPDCGEETKKGYPYCPCHAIWIRRHSLCYKCLQRKEVSEYKLCSSCHRNEIQHLTLINRKLAVNQGRCTNYWKCNKPVVRRGSMCEECYQEYLKRHFDPTPVSTLASTPAPVVSEAPTPQ